MERMTITLTDDQADSVKAAVESGYYASQSEVIRAALRDWAINQSFRKQALVELKSEIAKGVADITAGRVCDFDVDSIIEQGKQRLAARKSRSA